MTNIILPFLVSMLLGRTIDLRSYKISGSNAFDDSDFEETAIRTLNSTYYVIQGNAFPYNAYGMPTDIVLRIKSGFLSSSSGAMGLDGLLKDTSWKYNSAIVTVTNVYRTVERHLRPNATLLPGWTEKVPFSQTHYAHSLIYGGWSVVIFRFKCDIATDVDAVRKVLTRHLGVVGNIEEGVEKWKDALEDIKNDADIRGSVTLSTRVYSTAELKDPIESPADLFKSIRGLPDAVGTLGQPLFMNLKPMNDLDNRYPLVTENVETLGELKKLDEMMDDVRITKTSLMKWMSETLTIFEDDQEEQIAELINVLNDCIRAFNRVAAQVSLFSSVDRYLLDQAYHSYLAKLEKKVPNYYQAYRRLKEDIDAECQNSFLHKIRGLLRVYNEEERKVNKVEGGLEECQRLCLADQRCRSIGYSDHLSKLDLDTGLYFRMEKQCWIYYRSTNTATVYTPNGLSGDLGVYDRKCF